MYRYKFNSTFRIKEDAAKNSLPRVSSKAARRASRLNPNGRRTKTWRKAWAFLKPRLEAAGRTSCEFDFVPHVCEGPLDPAHSKKRHKMQGNDIYAVAIACRKIHDRLDLKMSHEEMESAVMQAINNNGGMILPDERKAA